MNDGSVRKDGIDYRSEMWPPKPWIISPTRKLHLVVVIPFLGLGLIMNGGGPIVCGILFVIWFICAALLSNLDWINMLTDGEWQKYVTSDYFSQYGDYYYDRITKKVYNKEESKKIENYEKGHPEKWRKDPDVAWWTYNDDGKHYWYDKANGFWITLDEYNQVLRESNCKADTIRLINKIYEEMKDKM